MDESDKTRLHHMLDASREASGFAHGYSRDDLDEDRRQVLALVKAVEIIGEAASRVSAEFQQQTTRIPWAVIIGMRNRLVHAYFDVDLDLLWDTVTNDLPPLIAELEKLLADDDE